MDTRNHTMDSPICRACLSNRGTMKSIFCSGKISGKLSLLSDMLRSCTSIEIMENDGLPDQICIRCVQRVSKAYSFKQQCINSDNVLRQTIENCIKEETYKSDPNTSAGETEQYIVDYLYEDEDKTDVKEEESEEIISRPDISELIVKEEIEVEYNDIDNDNHVDSEDPIDDDIRDADYTEIINVKSILKRKKHYRKVTARTRLGKRDKSKIQSPPYVCKECKKELKTYSSLKYHMQLHSDDTPYLCSQCGSGFKTKNSYDGHMAVHNLSNPHKCDTCGKTYRQAASLRNHIMTHTGERPFLCMVCGKGCIQKSDFKKHMLTHTDEKSFVCNICGNKYRFSHNLKLHIRSHTGEKPYSCKVCEKRFPAKDHLKRHSLIHTGEKPYSCEYCGKAFNRASTLAVHRKIHTGQRDHVCKVCGKGFIQAHCLHSHMHTHSMK